MGRAAIRLADLAAELGRQVEGDGAVLIGGVAALEDAGPSDLSFVRSKRFAAQLAASKAAAVILPPDLDAGGRPAIRSPHPGLHFARAARHVMPREAREPGAHASALIAEDARVDASASIGPRCVVASGCSVGARSVLHAGVCLYAGVEIGADCTLHSGCVLREGTRVGDRVTLQPGVVLGGDGFGYVAGERGRLEKTPQLGGVEIGDDVEIGANTTVDRGTLGSTRIGRGTKIDNLVQIAHNCQIGEDVVIVAQVGLAGSTTVERGAMLMAQSGAAGHLTIGEGALVGPQCGLHKDVPAGSRVLGSPQRADRTYHRLMAALTRLPLLLKRVRALERRLGPGAAKPDTREP